MDGVGRNLKDPLVQPPFVDTASFHYTRLLKSHPAWPRTLPDYRTDTALPQRHKLFFSDCNNITSKKIRNKSVAVNIPKIQTFILPIFKTLVITGASAVCKILHFLLLARNSHSRLPLSGLRGSAQASHPNPLCCVSLGCSTSQWAFPGHALHALSCSAGNSASTAACQSKSS